MANPVYQNNSRVTVIDSYLIDGVAKPFLTGTVALEITDPTGHRLADVAGTWLDNTNTVAKATFKVTIATMVTTINAQGQPNYVITKPPWKFQVRIDIPGDDPQYLNEFGVHVAPNLDDAP